MYDAGKKKWNNSVASGAIAHGIPFVQKHMRIRVGIYIWVRYIFSLVRECKRHMIDQWKMYFLLRPMPRSICYAHKLYYHRHVSLSVFVCGTLYSKHIYKQRNVRLNWTNVPITIQSVNENMCYALAHQTDLSRTAHNRIWIVRSIPIMKMNSGSVHGKTWFNRF